MCGSDDLAEKHDQIVNSSHFHVTGRCRTYSTPRLISSNPTSRFRNSRATDTANEIMAPSDSCAELLTGICWEVGAKQSARHDQAEGATSAIPAPQAALRHSQMDVSFREQGA
jgi:hypothetical protein